MNLIKVHDFWRGVGTVVSVQNGFVAEVCFDSSSSHIFISVRMWQDRGLGKQKTIPRPRSLHSTINMLSLQAEAVVTGPTSWNFEELVFRSVIMLVDKMRAIQPR